MSTLLLKNARIFDGSSADCAEGQQVVVENGVIREITERGASVQTAHVIDVGGRTVMPGLIDAHVHAYASDVAVQKIDAAAEAYRTAHAVRMLGFALECGFTTVRDIGGGDYGLARALEDGLIRGPHFLYAGRMISMTGGHGDFRQKFESQHTQGYCSCGAHNSVSVIADGVDECIRAAREELRRGAHCIKIMGSGGVTSPTDPVWMSQYREDEIRAVVHETTARGTYTSAHCHPIGAIRRCVEFGVRVIEHGTFMDDETARFVADKGAFVIPTVVILRALKQLGRQLGFPAQSQEKAEYAERQAMTGLESMRRAGVKVGFGTDLIGATYVRQCEEFSIRKEIFTPVEILRQATSVNAEILQLSGVIGCIKVGARADLIVVDGDPLQDIELLAANGHHLSVIMRGGELIRNNLT